MKTYEDILAEKTAIVLDMGIGKLRYGELIAESRDLGVTWDRISADFLASVMTLKRYMHTAQFWDGFRGGNMHSYLHYRGISECPFVDLADRARAEAMRGDDSRDIFRRLCAEQHARWTEERARIETDPRLMAARRAADWNYECVSPIDRAYSGLTGWNGDVDARQAAAISASLERLLAVAAKRGIHVSRPRGTRLRAVA